MGDPDKGRDIIYVKDVVSAIKAAIFSNDAKGLYNIASGKFLTLREQVQTTIKVFSPKNKPSEILYYPEKNNPLDHLFMI